MYNTCELENKLIVVQFNDKYVRWYFSKVHRMSRLILCKMIITYLVILYLQAPDEFIRMTRYLNSTFA